MFTKLERRMAPSRNPTTSTNSPVVAIASLNFPSKSTDSVRGREVLGSSRSLERRVVTPYRLGVFYSPLRFLPSVQPLPCVPPCHAMPCHYCHAHLLQGSPCPLSPMHVSASLRNVAAAHPLKEAVCPCFRRDYACIRHSPSTPQIRARSLLVSPLLQDKRFLRRRPGCRCRLPCMAGLYALTLSTKWSRSPACF